jgi:hypothetical protein
MLLWETFSTLDTCDWVSPACNRPIVLGSTPDRVRSGRPRVTTPAQDRHIRLRHLRDRFTTATSTAAAIPGQRRISDQTVRNLNVQCLHVQLIL